MGGSQLYRVVAGTTPFVPFTGATVNEIPVQVALAMVLILGVGCTSMVEVLGSPLQPLDMGVTVMVAVTSTFDVFSKRNQRLVLATLSNEFCYCASWTASIIFQFL